MKIRIANAPITYSSQGAGVVDHYAIISPHGAELAALKSFFDLFKIMKLELIVLPVKGEQPGSMVVLSYATDEVLIGPTLGSTTAQILLNQGGSIMNLQQQPKRHINVNVPKEWYGIDVDPSTDENEMDKVLVHLNGIDIFPVSQPIVVVYPVWHLDVRKSQNN